MSYTSSKKKANRHRSTERDTDISFVTIAQRAFAGAGISTLIAVILSLAASAVCMLFADPARLALPSGLVVYCASAAIGSALSVRKIKKDRSAALICGVLCGLSFVIILGLCSVVFGKTLSEYSGNMNLAISIILRMLAIPASLLGAQICASKSGRGHKRHR